jgi:hypothetical protein
MLMRPILRNGLRATANANIIFNHIRFPKPRGAARNREGIISLHLGHRKPVRSPEIFSTTSALSNGTGLAHIEHFSFLLHFAHT